MGSRDTGLLRDISALTLHVTRPVFVQRLPFSRLPSRLFFCPVKSRSTLFFPLSVQRGRANYKKKKKKKRQQRKRKKGRGGNVFQSEKCAWRWRESSLTLDNTNCNYGLFHYRFRDPKAADEFFPLLQPGCGNGNGDKDERGTRPAVSLRLLPRGNITDGRSTCVVSPSPAVRGTGVS